MKKKNEEGNGTGHNRLPPLIHVIGGGEKIKVADLTVGYPNGKKEPTMANRRTAALGGPCLGIPSYGSKLFPRTFVMKGSDRVICEKKHGIHQPSRLVRLKVKKSRPDGYPIKNGPKRGNRKYHQKTQFALQY